MKTKIAKILSFSFIAIIVILGTSSAALAAVQSLKASEFKDVKNINKIVISGNVDVFLTQGNTENLKVYNHSKNALIEYENGILRVASQEKEKLAIELTVTNLAAIEASGNVAIRSMNQLSGIDLNINLKSGAKADLEARVVNFQSQLSDSSRLDLAGDAENQMVDLSGLAQVETSKFTAQNRSIIVQDKAVASYSRDGVSTRIQAANADSKVRRF